jgi:hypothetical protein
MRHFISLLFIAVSIFQTGCSTNKYLINRRNDLADIVTIGSGAGLGAKARIGPIQTGLLFDMTLYALRGGTIATPENGGADCVVGSLESQALFVGSDVFGAGSERGKNYVATSLPVIPVSYVRSEDSWSYYTNIEVAADALIGVRIGVNPGELLDFLLGIVSVDILHDDK